MSERCNGVTPSGTRVRVEWDDSPYQARVWIDEAEVELAGRFAVSVFRDGGTVEIRTDRGTIVFPHRLNSDDRQPRLGREPICAV